MHIIKYVTFYFKNINFVSSTFPLVSHERSVTSLHILKEANFELGNHSPFVRNDLSGELKLALISVKIPDTFIYLSLDLKICRYRVMERSCEGKKVCTTWYEYVLHDKYMKYFEGQQS